MGISLHCHGNTYVVPDVKTIHFFCTKKLKLVLGYSLKPVWTNQLHPEWMQYWQFTLQAILLNTVLTRMWANAQRDGRPAKYRWRPLFNAAVWLTTTTRVPCSNAAKTRNPLKSPGVPQSNETISAASGPKFTILWGHVEEILLLNKFFSDCRYMP